MTFKIQQGGVLNNTVTVSIQMGKVQQRLTWPHLPIS